MSTQVTYIVYDRHNRVPVGKPYKNRKRAMARVDYLDNVYGGYRYSVKELETNRTIA